MTRWMYPPEIAPERARNAFDPVREGASYHLSPELSLAVWARLCAELGGLRSGADLERAQRRFHELAARLVGRGGRIPPDVGRVSRVDVELRGVTLASWSVEGWTLPVPGRDTQVSRA